MLIFRRHSVVVDVLFGSPRAWGLRNKAFSSETQGSVSLPLDAMRDRIVLSILPHSLLAVRVVPALPALLSLEEARIEVACLHWVEAYVAEAR